MRTAAPNLNESCVAVSAPWRVRREMTDWLTDHSGFVGWRFSHLTTHRDVLVYIDDSCLLTLFALRWSEYIVSKVFLS